MVKTKAIAVPADPPPQQIIRRSVQDEPTAMEQGPGAGTSFVIWMASMADAFQVWGTNVYRRDQELRDWWHTESILASAIYTVVAANAGFEWELEGPPETTEAVKEILDNADMGKGWAHFIQKISLDLYTQDNGAFFEIIRQSNSPNAPIIGIAHLESLRCTRTGDLRYPVIYSDRRGNLHKMPWYSVVPLEEFPSPIETMHGVQYCAVTRILRAAQIMRDMEIYRGEKVGGRFTEAVHIVGGVSRATIEDVQRRMEEQGDNAGLARYLAPLIVESLDPQTPPTHITLDMKSLPEHFNMDDEMRWYIAMIALGLGRDYQEFAPLPRSNLGSGLQSEVLHLKTRGKGPKIFMDIVDNAFNSFVMPRVVTFRYKDMDIDMERKAAEVAKERAEERSIRIDSGELDPIIARQIAVDFGDLDPKYIELMGERDLTPDMVREQRENIEAERPIDDKGLVRELVMKAWDEGSSEPLKKIFAENSFLMSIDGKIESIQDQFLDMVLKEQRSRDQQGSILSNIELILKQMKEEEIEKTQLIEVLQSKVDMNAEVLNAQLIESSEGIQSKVAKNIEELKSKITRNKKELSKLAGAHAMTVNLGIDVVEQEVIERDRAGRMKVIRKKFDSGQTFDYEVVERDSEGKIVKIRMIN